MARNMKPLAVALGATLVAAATTQVNASENPFSSTVIASGYKVAMDMEGKCGEGKCGSKPKPKAEHEGKCGAKDDTAAPAEGADAGTDESAVKADAEGKCGAKK